MRDQFLDKHCGLWLAERECESEQQMKDEPWGPNATPRPDWLGEEISDNPCYTNAYLALVVSLPIKGNES